MEMRGIKSAHLSLRSEIEEAIKAVFAHGSFIGGPEVAAFEQELADYTGVKHCVSCANGTDALCLILSALKIGAGDTVFVPAYTFFATAEAVMSAGAEAVLVDVSSDGNMSADCLRKAIESHRGGKARAVIGVDLFGNAADWDKIAAVANEYGLMLIEDAAQSIGGRFSGKMCGSFGVAAATSFFPSKPLGGVGDGGAVLTDDAKIAEAARSLREHGRLGDKYNHAAVGRNSRLDSIQAAVLRLKLRHLDEWTAKCEAAAARYIDMLPSGVVPIIPGTGKKSAWAQFVIKLSSKEVRKSVIAEFTRESIPYGIYYPAPLNKQPVMINSIYTTSITENGFVMPNQDNLFPISELLSETTLAVPIHAFITEEEQKSVINAINRGRT